jgi:hypothetical protein
MAVAGIRAIAPVPWRPRRAGYPRARLNALAVGPWNLERPEIRRSAPFHVERKDGPQGVGPSETVNRPRPRPISCPSTVERRVGPAGRSAGERPDPARLGRLGADRREAQCAARSQRDRGAPLGARIGVRANADSHVWARRHLFGTEAMFHVERHSGCEPRRLRANERGHGTPTVRDHPVLRFARPARRTRGPWREHSMSASAPRSAMPTGVGHRRRDCDRAAADTRARLVPRRGVVRHSPLAPGRSAFVYLDARPRRR